MVVIAQSQKSLSDVHTDDWIKGIFLHNHIQITWYSYIRKKWFLYEHSIIREKKEKADEKKVHFGFRFSFFIWFDCFFKGIAKKCAVISGFPGLWYMTKNILSRERKRNDLEEKVKKFLSNYLIWSQSDNLRGYAELAIVIHS